MKESRKYVMIIAADKLGVRYHSTHIFETSSDLTAHIAKMRENGWEDIEVHNA